MGRLQRFIESQIPGVHVHSVMVGESPAADTMHGFLGNVNDQVEEACAALAADTKLAGGFNAVGFSQGGQFLRAVVQRCGGGGGGGGGGGVGGGVGGEVGGRGDGRGGARSAGSASLAAPSGGLKVKRLITMGGQHQGVASIPGCDTFSGTAGSSLFCKAAEAAVTTAVYSRYTRSSVVQAQYFKDPARISQYLEYNPFLPDVNNEKEVKNEAYKTNLAALEELVLIRFTNDTVVVPRDSAWFSTYAPGAGTGRVVPLREQQMYTEDWLGLRALDDKGALTMSDCPGNHMQFSDEWFKENVIDKYLRDDDSVGGGKMGGERGEGGAEGSTLAWGVEGDAGWEGEVAAAATER